MILRSLLFTPANHARHVEKALGGPADAVILDLEDAVANDEKTAARDRLSAVLRDLGRGAGPAVFVRVNSLTTPFARADLDAAVSAGVYGVLLPKVDSVAQLAIADWLMGQLETERGLEAGSIEVVPLVETAAGLTRIDELAAASPRVRRLTFGAGDFTLDTGMEWSPDNEGLLWARVRTVIVSRAAGLAPAIDTVFARLADRSGFEAEATQARRLGFGGKLCLHPDQVDRANEVFTPSADAVADAEAVIKAFASSEAAGNASIQLDGRFIDYPIAEQARRLIETRRLALKGEART